MKKWVRWTLNIILILALLVGAVQFIRSERESRLNRQNNDAAMELAKSETTPPESITDPVEDTDVTVEEIREIFGDRIADAVALLTHADGVPYMDYVREIAKDPLARRVKLADLTSNMDISRIPNPGQRDFDRIEKKYRPAYVYLKGQPE